MRGQLVFSRTSIPALFDELLTFLCVTTGGNSIGYNTEYITNMGI